MVERHRRRGVGSALLAAARRAVESRATAGALHEVAVSAFLEGSLKFTDLPLLIQQVMNEHEVKPVQTIEDILRADQWGREKAKSILQRRKLC